MPYIRNIVTTHRPRSVVGETAAEVDELLSAGLSAEKISLQLHLPRTSVAEYVRSVRGAKRPVLHTPELDARVRELKNQGLTQREIAAELGIRQPAVSYSLRRTAPSIPAPRLGA